MQGAGPYDVFVDANVWFSRTLRDWIGMLYTTPDHPPFVVHWTEDVLAELLYHLRKTHPDWSGLRITTIRDRMAGAFEGGRVDQYVIDAAYGGTDVGDAHVHSAAVACSADVLVTCNVKDFVWDENQSTYEVMHPDDFLILAADSFPELVQEVTQRMSAYWVARSGESNLPAALRKADCPRFADRVRHHLHRMM